MAGRRGQRLADETMRRSLRCDGPTVVKIGGSCAASLDLRRWRAAVAGWSGQVAIVPGGGPFADAVGAAKSAIGLDDAAAYHMAMLAMEQYARTLANFDARLTL